MKVKINGRELNCHVSYRGKLVCLNTPNDGYDLSLARSDNCELLLDGELLRCSVAESYVKARYGKPKERILILRIDSKLEKKPEKAPITKEAKNAIKKVLDKHSDVLEKLKDNPKDIKKKSESKPKKSKKKKKDK